MRITKRKEVCTECGSNVAWQELEDDHGYSVERLVCEKCSAVVAHWYPFCRGDGVLEEGELDYDLSDPLTAFDGLVACPECEGGLIWYSE